MQEKTSNGNTHLSTECSGTARNPGGSRGHVGPAPKKKGQQTLPGGLRPLSMQPSGCTRGSSRATDRTVPSWFCERERLQLQCSHLETVPRSLVLTCCVHPRQPYFLPWPGLPTVPSQPPGLRHHVQSGGRTAGCRVRNQPSGSHA